VVVNDVWREVDLSDQLDNQSKNELEIGVQLSLSLSLFDNEIICHSTESDLQERDERRRLGDGMMMDRVRSTQNSHYTRHAYSPGRDGVVD